MNKVSLAIGLKKIMGLERVCLNGVKVCSYSGVHSNCTFFLKNLQNGRTCWVNQEINLLRVVNTPFNFMIYYFVDKVFVLMMVSHLFGFTSISLSVRWNPRNFLVLTLNVHFLGFNLMFNWHTQFNTVVWLPSCHCSSSYLIIMSAMQAFSFHQSLAQILVRNPLVRGTCIF